MKTVLFSGLIELNIEPCMHTYIYWHLDIHPYTYCTFMPLHNPFYHCVCASSACVRGFIVQQTCPMVKRRIPGICHSQRSSQAPLCNSCVLFAFILSEWTELWLLPQSERQFGVSSNWVLGVLWNVSFIVSTAVPWGLNQDHQTQKFEPHIIWEPLISRWVKWKQ